MNFTVEEASTNSSALEIGVILRLREALYYINFLVGLPTHFYVVRLIVAGSGFAAEFFILNLSVCEIGNCLSSFFYVLSEYSSCPAILAKSLEGLCTTGRPMFQCLMCVERFLAVVHPVTFLKLKPLRYRIFCCSVSWSFSFITCLCYVITVNILQGDIFTCFFLIQYIVFISVQLFCCVSVLRALKQSGPGERKEENHRKRRAFNLILIITVSMGFTYVPYTVTAFCYVLTKRTFLESWLVSLTCYILTGFLPPILYLKNTGKNV